MDSVDPSVSMLVRLATTVSEPTGLDTFRRFTWQAKQAVRLWLSTLASSGPSFVVCELVDDITLVYPDRVAFLQLKTRKRGSWSASIMAASGLDALVRSYAAACQAGIVAFSQFQLWLEGPISDGGETAALAADPTTARQPIRTRLLEHAAKLQEPLKTQLATKPKWIDDFLAKTAIMHGQPPTSCIDDKVLLEIGTLWPYLTTAEALLVYGRLLEAAEAAQSGEPSPAQLRQGLAARIDQGGRHGDVREWADSPDLAAVRHQVLDPAILGQLAPPLPGQAGSLLAEIAAGQGKSPLELKMYTGGAAADTMEETKALRADMEVHRQLLLSSRSEVEDDLERLAVRVLAVARAAARSIRLSAAVDPAAASRPAEALATAFMADPGRLGSVDSTGLFGGDGFLVYGYLAHLSDLCRFPWRAQ